MNRKVVTAIAGVLALGLASCAPAGDREAAGENVLTFVEPQFFTTLYPPAAGYYPNGGVVNQITDRLLYQDPETLELHPWIATELPEINATATEYTFNIRTDVTYSDGTPLTADNVVANFDLYGKGDKARLLNSSEQISSYDRGEVVDEDTVRFYFTEASPGFLQAVSGYNAGLLSDATLQLDTSGFAPGQATGVIGSGPFVIADETLGTDLVLTAREDYDWAPPVLEHQGRAFLDGIHYVLAAEESVRAGALISGQADIARQISAPVESQLEDRGIHIIARGTNSMNNQLSFRFNHPYLQDQRVREAIIHAVDREEILRILFSPTYPLATSAVATTGLGYKDQSAAYTYSPELSAQLLDASGWLPGADGIREKDGQRLTLRINIALPQPRSKEVLTMLQEQLRTVGIGLSVNSGDLATQNAQAKKLDETQIYHNMVGRADYDAIQSMYSLHNRDVLLNQDAEGNPIDAHLEDLLNAVVRTPDPAGRKHAVEAVQDYLTEKAYILPLFEEPVVYAVAPHVTGFQPEAIARPWFYDTRIDRESTQEN
ncbi:MAG: TIGR04028 family ABC transporter substrate-binding protein [Corynebacterium sp.]|nr:TIGR04028 family ABC transporter substrate-binding protein [Corynebacterium sp.]